MGNKSSVNSDGVRMEGHCFISVSEGQRVRTSDGRHVFVIFPYFGLPRVFKDKGLCREIEDWVEDADILGAVSWAFGKMRGQ